MIVKHKKNKRQGDAPREDTGHKLLDCYRSYCIKHIDYNTSMTYNGLVGVFDIDKTVEIYSITNGMEIVGTMNLRSVFYAMKMMDGSPLIAEIHQADPMMNVDVVVGKTEEAVSCVDMINKNIAAYLTFNFPIKEADKDFITRLLKVSVDPKLTINGLTADRKSVVSPLIT